jgi:hypothetical protein
MRVSSTPSAWHIHYESGLYPQAHLSFAELFVIVLDEPTVVGGTALVIMTGVLGKYI